MCGIVGAIDTELSMIKGSDIVEAITLLRERGNGLGSGYAVYGIYPEFKDLYAIHIACDNEYAVQEAENYIKAHTYVKAAEDIPIRNVKSIKWHPILRRYFVMPGPNNEDFMLKNMDPGNLQTEEEFAEIYMKNFVFDFNKSIKGAFVMSCGKNMGVFKGVGYPDEIGEFYMIDRMEGYIWLAHNRFPTNSQSWWGGAHPFSLLEWTVVHNGEITSYGVNRNYIEMHGYKCLLQTDTEVISYLFDFFVREKGFSIEDTCTILSPPLWEEIDEMEDDKEKKRIKLLRQFYPQALLNGPFAILVSNGSSLIAMNDNLKLRPLVAAKSGSRYYFSSEECSFEILCPEREKTWMLSRNRPEIISVKEIEYV